MKYNPSQLKDLADRYSHLRHAKEIFEDLAAKFELVKDVDMVERGESCLLYCVAGTMRGTLLRATRRNYHGSSFDVREILTDRWVGRYRNYKSAQDYLLNGLGGNLTVSNLDEIIETVKDRHYQEGLYRSDNSFDFVVVWNSEVSGATKQPANLPEDATITGITVNGKTINPLDLSAECLKELLKFAK